MDKIRGDLIIMDRTSFSKALREEFKTYYGVNNIPFKYEGINPYNQDYTFHKDEFKRFSKLQLIRESKESLKNSKILKYCTNLKSIQIAQCPYLSQDDINDMLKNNPSLNNIEIFNQDSVYELDFSNNEKMKILKIVGNNFLFKVKGLENCTNLDVLDFYSNDNIDELESSKLINLTYEKILNGDMEANLDVLYMPEFLKCLAVRKNSLKDFEYSNLSWGENYKLFISHDYKYSTGLVLKAYKKAFEITDQYISHEDGEFQKYSILYNWVADNIVYDYSIYEDRNNKQAKDLNDYRLPLTQNDNNSSLRVY